MNHSVRKKIPTILGLIILIFGIGAGVVLLNAKQVFRLGAIEDTVPKNIKISNVSGNGFVFSFITNKESRSFIKVGRDRYFIGDFSILRQEGVSTVHYFNIEDLSSETKYFISVSSDGINYFSDNPWEIVTGEELVSDTQGRNIYGKVYSKSGEEQENALIYVQCGNGSLLSTKTSEDGSWSINISKTRTADLSSYLTINEKTTPIQILVQYEELTSFINTNSENIHPLPPIVLGNNYDLRNQKPLPDTAILPTPYVFGASYSSDLPFVIQNIYKERQSEFANE